MNALLAHRLNKQEEQKRGTGANWSLSITSNWTDWGCVAAVTGRRVTHTGKGAPALTNRPFHSPAPSSICADSAWELGPGPLRIHARRTAILSTPRAVVEGQGEPYVKVSREPKRGPKGGLGLVITHSGTSRAGPSSLTGQAAGTLEHTGTTQA